MYGKISDIGVGSESYLWSRIKQGLEGTYLFGKGTKLINVILRGAILEVWK